MPRITRVYTRQGDGGSSRLAGGQEVEKDAVRLATYGTVDELSSVIGVVVASGVADRLRPELQRIQNELFHLGSDLAVLEEDKERMPVPTIEVRHVEALEALMDELTREVGPLKNFILPGGSLSAAHLHVARTVCRRAERHLVTLAREERVGSQTLPYLNRLSDALFVMARYENLRQATPDVLWDSRA